jgi:hypothetical protein
VGARQEGDGVILPCPTPLVSFALERALGKLNGKAARTDAIAEAKAQPTPFPFKVAHDLRGVPRADEHARGRPAGVRPISNVVGVTWHCTASGHLNEDHPNLPEIPAGALLHRSGAVTLLGNFTDYMQHGHALNGGTFGIEVDCRPCRIEGDKRTFWMSEKERNGYVNDKGRRFVPQRYEDLVREATDAQLATIPLLLAWCIDEVKRLGGVPGIRACWAHRQGRGDRVSDPGSRVWSAVRKASAEQGLKNVEHMTLGDGHPINDWRAA